MIGGNVIGGETSRSTSSRYISPRRSGSRDLSLSFLERFEIGGESFYFRNIIYVFLSFTIKRNTLSLANYLSAASHFDKIIVSKDNVIV